MPTLLGWDTEVILVSDWGLWQRGHWDGGETDPRYTQWSRFPGSRTKWLGLRMGLCSLQSTNVGNKSTPAQNWISVRREEQGKKKMMLQKKILVMTGMGNWWKKMETDAENDNSTYFILKNSCPVTLRILDYRPWASWFAPPSKWLMLAWGPQRNTGSIIIKNIKHLQRRQECVWTRATIHLK